MNTSYPTHLLRRVRLIFRVKKTSFHWSVSARQVQVGKQNLALLLLIALGVAWAVGGISHNKPTHVSIQNETSTQVRLAMAPQAFAHTSAQRWSEINFGTFRRLAQQDSFVQQGYSAWYCLELDTVAAPITLDFSQFRAVRLFDEAGREQWPQVGEFLCHTPAHERHIGFEVAASPYPQHFFAKVYARTSLKTDRLALCVTSSGDFITHIYQRFYDNRSLFVLLIFVAGIGTFQVFYVAALGWSRRRPEYWDYLGFCGFCIIYVLIARWLEMGVGPHTRWVVMANEGLFGIFTLFYFRFVRNYLDTAKLDPRLHDQLKMVERLLFMAVLTNWALFLVTDDREFSDRFYTVVKIGSMTLNFYFLIWFIRFRSQLVNYLLFGAAVMVISGFGKYIYAALLELGIFSKPVNFDFVTIIGGLLDATCLILGLHYKHRLEVIANEKAVDIQRQRISTELHDEFSSTLSSFALFSTALQAMLGDIRPEARNVLKKMIDNAKTSAGALHDIVWAIDVQHDHLSDLLLRMREHLNINAAAAGVHIDWQIPALDQDVRLHPTLKKNLWLIFKEASTNALRCAGATRMIVELWVKYDHIHLILRDNGTGFDPATVRAGGNGLRNMRKRAIESGGMLEIETAIGQGTCIRAQLLLQEPV